MTRWSIVVPLLLLGLGVLFLANTLNPEMPLFRLVAEYWPFLLIGWGALRLIEILVLAGLPLLRRASRGTFAGAVLLAALLGANVARMDGPCEAQTNYFCAVVEADPASTDPEDYAAAKRGGELAVQQEFDGPAGFLRAGLILGPYENVGRLPFWLTRIARGGRVPAPGPYDRPLQLIDARDLGDWVIDHQPIGALNTVSRPGHTTIGEVLETCVKVTGSDAELVWLSPEVVEPVLPEALDPLLPWCETRGVGFLAAMPLGSGFLTGTLTPGEGFEPDDLRARHPRFTAEMMAANQPLVAGLRRVAERHGPGTTPAQVALAWVLGQGRHVVPVPGAKRERWAVENAAPATCPG